MSRLEENLRATVEDLADDAPRMNDLAMIARVRGGRLRRRRQAVLGVSVVLLLGAAITPYAVLNGRRDGNQPQPAVSVTQSRPAVVVPKIRQDWWKAPIQLPGGVVVTSISRSNSYNSDGSPTSSGDTFQDGNVVLDRSTGRYRVFPAKYQVFTAAPTGRYILIEDGSHGAGYVPVGFVSSVTGGSHLFDHGAGLGAEWSPDGTTVAMRLLNGDLRIMEAKSGTEHDRSITEGSGLCPDYCFFTWLPGGREVALPQVDPAVPQSESVQDTIKEVKVYSAATGKVVRTLPIPGVPAGSGAWSPDGRHVVLLPDGGSDTVRIAEVATGRVVATLPNESPAISGQVRFLGNDQVLILTRLQATVFDLAGKVLATSELPEDFENREVTLGVE